MNILEGHETSLENAYQKGLRLLGVKGLSLGASSFDQCQFVRCQLDQEAVNFFCCTLDHCHTSIAQKSTWKLIESEWSNSQHAGAEFQSFFAQKSRIQRCDFRSSVWNSVTIDQCQWEACDLSYSVFEQSMIKASSFKDCYFHRTTFKNCLFQDFDFRQMPDGLSFDGSLAIDCIAIRPGMVSMREPPTKAAEPKEIPKVIAPAARHRFSALERSEQS